MRRHEIARIVEVSSSLFAPLGAPMVMADWLMSFPPDFVLFCSCGGCWAAGVLSILRGEKKREGQCPVEAVRPRRAIPNDPLAKTARSGAALARCGAWGLSANSLARFLHYLLRRFPVRFLRGLFGGLLRPLRRSSLHCLPVGFFNGLLLFCSLVRLLGHPFHCGALPSRSGSNSWRRDHHGIGNQTVGRQRDIGGRPLIPFQRRLFGLQGMIGGVRGDVGDVFHRVGDLLKYRFV